METAIPVMMESSSSFFSKSIDPFNPRNFGALPCLQGVFHQPLINGTFKCIQSSSKNHRNCAFSPKPIKKFISFSCSVLASSFSDTSSSNTKTKLQSLISEFQTLHEPLDRVKRLLNYASDCPLIEESLKKPENRVHGCTAHVWLNVAIDDTRNMRFKADSDSEITKGFCSCLISVLNGATPEEILELKTDDLAALNVVGVNGKNGLISRASRVNTWHNVLVNMQKKTKALVAELEGRSMGDPFPSLIITANGIEAKGSYTQAQVEFPS